VSASNAEFLQKQTIMKYFNTKKKWVNNLLKGLVLLLMIALIAQLYPHKNGTFQYRFEEGRPWSYGLMTAPFDFPIFKGEEQLQEEQRELLRDFAPYYKIDAKLAQQQISEIRSASSVELTPSEQAYLIQQVTAIYNQGIMPVDDMNKLAEEGYHQVNIINSKHIAQKYPLTYCYTPRTAYDMLLAGSPEGATSMINRVNLNRLLIPNLTYDSVRTASMRDKKLSELTPSMGMVQKGEKIIDRGEIVDANTYLILQSLRRAMSEQGMDFRRAIWSVAGIVTLICLFILLMTLYLLIFRPQLFKETRSFLFFAVLMSGIIVTSCLVERFTPLSIYIVPFAWVPIITRVFFDSRTALYLHMVTVLICSFMAPVPFEFLVLQMAAGMVAVSSLKDMAQRSQLAQTAGWIFLTYSLCYTAFILAAKGSPSLLHWPTYVYFLANALLVVFSYGLIYLFERVFKLVSSITLVELTNINSDLMLEFAEKAPGTFQHSLQVSNLAMEAAKQVGANTLLVRTGGLYHDIGKMLHPENFTENQQDGQNPLLMLSCTDAAHHVINHVTDGVELAEKHQLPEIVISFIKMHHGTSKTRYFYNSYINSHPGEPVDESLFQYPGPRPNTKETAILMMADAVEARSRSLTEYTPESIRNMVDQMVGMQLADGQFENTPLTLKDIQEIKAVFTRKIISMNHHRISYPEIQFPNK